MSAVRSPLLFWVSMVLVLIVLGFAADRGLFLLHAVHTTGSVVDLSANNDRCSCGRHCHYDCTKFQAQVRFETAQSPAALWVRAGTAHGYDSPVSLARYVMGDAVPVVFNSRNPGEAYRDSFIDVWGTPLTLFVCQIMTLIGSFNERRHRS